MAAKKKRKRRKPPDFPDLVKMLDQIPRDEAAQIMRPYTGMLVKVMLKVMGDPRRSRDECQGAEKMVERVRAWLTHLRDTGLAPKDLAKMYGMTERELRALLARESLN
jgi:hypothetical protein